MTSKAKINPAQWRCSHGHTGLEHPVCFLKECPQNIGILDIEATGLQADFGYILSWYIKHYHEDKYDSYVLTKKDYESKQRDRRSIEELIKALAQFDTIITFYGGDWQYDMPFIRARALGYGLQFIPYGTCIHIDMYKACKSKLKLHAGNLDSVAEMLGVPEKKTKVETKCWVAAQMGYDEDALRYISEHNKIDVDVLEKVYDIMQPYIPITRKSI